MPTINQLSAVDSLSPGDNFPIYNPTNGDARRTPLSLLQTYMQDNLDFSGSGSFVTQYAAPSATGFSVTIQSGTSVHLILTPVAGYAAGTIVLPPIATLEDKTEVLVNCTQAVTTLTVSANGAGAVTGAPATLAANAFFRLKYDSGNDSWYRVG